MNMLLRKNKYKNIKIFCINLPNRVDKKRACRKEFKKANLKVIFSAGIKHKIRYFGCTLSHLKIIHMAIKRKYDYVCVFEDDIHLHDPLNFKQNLENALKSLPDDWHILYLGGLIGRDGILKRINKHIYSASHFMCTYGIVYNQKSYFNIINNFPEDSKNITEKKIIRDGYGSIDSWLAFIYQKKYPCYVTSSLLVSERKEFSDIKNKVRSTKMWYLIRFFMFKYKMGFLLNFLGKFANSLKIQHEFLRQK